MPIKKKDTMISRRFNGNDVSNWQKEANKTHNGNLTAWIEDTLNAASLPFPKIKSMSIKKNKK